MALLDVLSGIDGIVAGLTPASQPGYPFVPFGGDNIGSFEDAAAMRPRLFETVASGAPFDGDNISAADLGFHRQSVSVRIGYPSEMDRDGGRLQSLMTADLMSVYSALRTPANWSSFAFELTPEVQTRVEEITGESGVIVGYVATVDAVAEWEV